MYNIRANNEDTIELISVEPINNKTCSVDFLPDDFYFYLPFGKYKANNTGLYIVDGWVDFSKEKIDYILEYGNYNIPVSISKLQAITRLIELNRYDELITILESDNTGKSLILFNAAHVLDRDSNMVNQIGQALQMSQNDIDDFFVDASKILV